MDTEKIILNKKFYELSPSEKEAIKDYAQNDTEFNEIKSFLLATKQTFDQQKLQVSDNLSQSILNHLKQPIKQKKTWYNTLMLFLFPKQKQFYQYPAFQIAFASLLILFIINILPDISNEGQLAINDEISTTKKEQKVKTKNIFENEVVDEISNSKNIPIKSNNIKSKISKEKQLETIENKTIEPQESEAPINVNTSVVNTEEIIEQEIQNGALSALTNKDEEDDDNNEIVSDGISTGIVPNASTNKKKVKNRTNKTATNAYNSTQDNQPTTLMDSENIPIQRLSIQSTPNILQLFYISK